MAKELELAKNELAKRVSKKRNTKELVKDERIMQIISTIPTPGFRALYSIYPLRIV